jgi:hypothetical protein
VTASSDKAAVNTVLFSAKDGTAILEIAFFSNGSSEIKET